MVQPAIEKKKKGKKGNGSATNCNQDRMDEQMLWLIDWLMIIIIVDWLLMIIIIVDYCFYDAKWCVSYLYNICGMVTCMV